MGYDIKVEGGPEGGPDPIIVGNRVHSGYTYGIVFSHESTKGVLRSNDVYAHRKAEVLIEGGASPILEGNKLHDGAGYGVLV